MAKKVDNIEVDLKETKKLMVEMNEQLKKIALDNNYIEEEYDVDVRYVDETEGLRMIIDSGAPMLIVSVGWLEKYLREMGVNKKYVQERRCKRRFKFGESLQ